MSYQVPEQLHADHSLPVIVHAQSLAWTPSPLPGVERRFLERQGAEIARATSIVRYAPNSAFSAHVHDKGEEYLVLDGVFCDEHGEFPLGTYVRNPPGSHHAPFTREGCVIFVKLRQMDDAEQDTIVLPSISLPTSSTSVNGLARTHLFERPGAETVGIERLAPGTQWLNRNHEGGEEILVIEGQLTYGASLCPRLTWLRIPDGMEQPMSSAEGCRYWVKRGHLMRTDR